ncbi:GspE/PulE family protein [Sinorhizobium fredii]|uniref:Type II/IV secretion system protein n=1 Tax=Sinorhizobium fredii (strain HH103) TaxID=1117943 RepID=G9AB85_SINF1|nr:GspE/PulE family protein [Sinorhizobium fredii]ASY70274.1 Type IV fimbrial assembly, ATPase PilB [Sinorhizobium fredii CCBAU 83666]CCE97176.1 Type II/IV secretion system protein [Sinorhizobium fredii HH103]
MNASNTPSISGFIAFLQDKGRWSHEAGQRVRAALSTSYLPFDVVVTELGITRDDDLVQWLNEYLGVPSVSMPETEVLSQSCEGFDLAFGRAHAAIPISSEGAEQVVALANPLDEAAVALLEYYFDTKLQIRVFPRREIVSAIDGLPSLEDNEVFEASSNGPLAFEDDVDRLRDIALEAPIISLVSTIAQSGFDSGATDIHIEPFQDRIRIRYRRDGLLSNSEYVPKQALAGIATRIKILAGLNIVERRLPQDGRMRLALRGNEVDFRVSIIPSVHGETIVLRLLHAQVPSLDLSKLGFDPAARDAVAELARSPHGVLIVTGPTGSGKTTTLYSLVRQLNREGVKIFTIEDPVEYQMEGVTQLQVNSAVELDFARALRSVLRQDPDIILVGEIRDRETAQIAIQAALTGHLVLTTLHTNTAAGAVTRLRDMGIEEYLISATLRGVIAQRLVRVLCSCAKSDGGGEPGTACQSCGGQGYSGRRAIYEILRMGPGLAGVLERGASEASIEQQGIADGMITMGVCAERLVRDGVTDQKEIARVLNTSDVS